MEKILIVEDELIVARDLRKTLERNGHKVVAVASSVDQALQLLADTNPWLVLIDIFLKGSLTGIDLALQLNKQGIAFIYVSANSNQGVLEAVKTTDPYGFIVKPFREKDLLVTIDIARYRYENNKTLKSKVHVFSEAVENKNDGIQKENEGINAKKKTGFCEGIIGKTAAMLQVFRLIEQVAGSDTSVLLLGESGTGKEGVARCIFTQSKRSNKPFIKINCAAIPSALLEAELFGYEKGAFTGANERKAGKFEAANCGTLLLDEIREMPIDMQVKLLRVLQEREIQRIGSNTTIKIDVRIITATSKNLEKEVAEGRFRLDLYYRLYVFPILLPALRDRKDDIPALVAHFLNQFSVKSGKAVPGMAQGQMEKLFNYHWPGNVRELEHLLERSALMAANNFIKEIILPQSILTMSPVAPQVSPLKTLEQNEREHILAALKKSNGKVRGPGGAAEILELPPTTLHSKMKKLGIKKIAG